MAELKNPIIAAMVVAMIAQISAEGITPKEKKELEKRVDQLTKLDGEITIVVTASNAKDVTITNLKNDLAEGDLFAKDLQNKLTSANSIIENLTEQLSEAGEVIKDYAVQLSDALEKAADKSEFPVGEYAGVKYQVISGAHGIGTAKEIAADPEKLAKILNIKGQAVVQPLIEA